MKDENLLEAYKKSAVDDYTGLYEIIGNIQKNLDSQSYEQIQKRTLDFIKLMLVHKFQAGKLLTKGGFLPWENQNPDYVINRIKSEWDALGHTPSIGDIAYFDLPKT